MKLLWANSFRMGLTLLPRRVADVAVEPLGVAGQRRAVAGEVAGEEIQRGQQRRARKVFLFELLRHRLSQLGAEFEGFLERGVVAGFGHVAVAQVVEAGDVGPPVLGQPGRLLGQVHVNQGVRAKEIELEVGEDFRGIRLEHAEVVVFGREFDRLFPDVGLGDFERAGVFIHAPDVAEQEGGDQLPVLLLLQEVALAEVRRMENLGRQVEKFLAVLTNLPGPAAGVGDAAVLLPKARRTLIWNPPLPPAISTTRIW